MSQLKQILNREPVYINPYTDFGFKRLFGQEGSKELLIDFLNQMLPEHHQIDGLKFRNPENIPDLQHERKAFFDISCISTSGEEFIVEMQKAKVKNFKDRSLFYTTYPIRRQAKRGKWDFELKPVYFIAILDFEYDDYELSRKFYREVALKDQDGELFFDKLHFKYLQMPLFDKNESQLETHFDKWLYFLKNLENFDEIPNILKEPVFEKGFEIAKLAKMKTQEFTAYERSRLAYWENEAVVDTAREEAWNEAWNKAWNEAWNKSFNEKTKNVILNCIKQGLSAEVTATIAEVPVEFVKKVMLEMESKKK